MADTTHPFWIGGRYKTSDCRWTVTSPYDQTEVGTTFLATASDIEEAIRAAVSAFEITRRVPSYQRAEWLHRIATGLGERQNAFARMIVLESGKPIVDARREVLRAMLTFQAASEEAKRMGGEVLPLDWMAGSEGCMGITRRFPIGPIVGITPFNFPLNLVAHKIAPALASGNTILLKPAPQAPLTALLLSEVIAASGTPPGAVSIFLCENALAEHGVQDARIKMLTFTGSGSVGWALKARVPKKRVVLELGGNAAAIIHTGADIAHAAGRCAMGGFAYAGQTCISVQRIFVHEEYYATFCDRLCAHSETFKPGDPLDEATTLSPMIHENAAKRAEAWIQEAASAGAKILAGGKRLGSVVFPTVLTETTPSMKINCEEIFAPVVTVTPYTQFDEALSCVNRSAYGLQAGLFASNMQDIFHAFERLEVGGMIVNDVPTYRMEHMPYGGIKESGFGREGIKYAIEEMTELKLMALRLR